MINKLGVVGAGYVGLVSAACFADLGFYVCVIDNDANRIQALKRGEIPIHEPQLEELVKKAVQSGHIVFSNSYDDIKDSCAVIMAVGTPSNSDGSANLEYLYSAVKQLSQVLKNGSYIILKSTVPIGTAESVRNLLAECAPNKVYPVINNPEFLREGNAIHDFQHPDRIVIGISDQSHKERMQYLYSHFIKNQVPVLFTDNATAETIKYASNAYLAMRIAFINEIAMICEKSGADVKAAAEGMGLDTRIGRHYLQPGPGFGGSCFPKDTKALSYYANANELDTPIISNIMRSNTARTDDLNAKIDALFMADKRKNIAVLGATFKANTDDMRDSPAIPVIRFLIEQGYNVRCYDPSHTKQFREYFDFDLLTTAQDALHGADAVLVLTEWSEFQLLPVTEFSGKIVYDLRNILNGVWLKNAGINYHCIG